MTYAIQKTTKSGAISIEMRGLTKKRADHLAVMCAFADADGSRYEVVEDI